MREALARTDHDFVVSEPVRRRKAAPQRNALGFIGTLIRLVCRIAAYPNRVAGALVFALTVAIIINALMLQHSRHPAPLFHKTVSLHVQPPAEKHAAPAESHAVAAKTWHDPIGQWIGARLSALSSHSSVEKPKLQPHRRAHEETAKSEPQPPARDSVAQLLESNASQEKSPEELPRTVLAVQHALLKLGFVVRPDGQMGTVTRHALEQFERSHGLLQDGRLTPSLLRKLSAESGVTIE